MNTIQNFRGAYGFLSNFYEYPFTFNRRVCATAEHHYQCLKATNLADRERIANATSPGEAKRLGRMLKCRPDWDVVKLQFMLEILRAKFKQPELRHLLLATGSREIIEGNTWGDTFWGVCRGQGENHLGRLLMQVRSEVGP